MSELKEKHLRPGRKVTDQFLIASVLATLIVSVAVLLIPLGELMFGFFESVLGGDSAAATFLKDYFNFISIWIGLFLVVVLF